MGKKTNTNTNTPLFSPPKKFTPTSLLRPPSLLELRLTPKLRCDAMKSSVSFVEKSSSKSQQQITLFYNGEVNVYDNISAEKAQKIMLILDDGDSDVREGSNLEGIMLSKNPHGGVGVASRPIN
ncbi:hypothetical protein CsatB_030882 [Cannabis sativa]